MATTYATKECLYCGRINNAEVNQCVGCGASSFGPIQIVRIQAQYTQVAPQAPLPPIQQIQPAIRIVYLLFVGLIIGFYWIIFSALVMLTIIGYPLGRALLSLLPAVATLQKQRQSFGDTLGQGLQETVTTFRGTSLPGKIIGIAVFAMIVATLVWLYSR